MARERGPGGDAAARTGQSRVAWRYVPAGPWAAAKIESQVQHLKASFRTGERREGGRVLVDATGEIPDQAAARALLSGAIGPRVVFHRLILSPGPRSGLARADDLQEWTRAILMDLGRELGQRLVYVAAVHTNTDAPHCHVLIGGAAVRTRPPGKGSTVGVELRKAHWSFDGFLEQRGDVHAAEIRARDGDGTAA